MNKKGISPLISTIVLISFAIALGLVVMSWGKTYAAEETKTCEDIRIAVLDIEGTELCYGNGQLAYAIENRGKTSIDRLKIFVITSEGIDKLEQEGNIDIADISRLKTNYNTNARISKIKITPEIYINGVVTSCPAEGAEIDKINDCGE